MPSGPPFEVASDGPAPTGAGNTPWARRLAWRYLTVVVAATLLVGVLSLLRVREEALHHTPFLFFAVAFAITLVGRVAGLLATVLLLTVASSLHFQINALFGTHLSAWSYPGVDAAVGFLTALCLSRDRKTVIMLPLDRLPSLPLLALHAWIAVSVAVAIARNLRQSGSEFTPRGLWFNTMHLRRLGPLHDYFPLQDLFFVSVAIVTLLAAWGLLITRGRRLAMFVTSMILVGAAVNAIFAAWQRMTRGGWYFDTVAFGPNAFLPDFHSFAAMMAMALFLALARLAAARREGRSTWMFAAATALFALGLFVSQSRGTVTSAVALLLVLAVGVAFVGRGSQRLAAVVAICLLGLAVDVLLTAGYRGLSYESLTATMREFRPEVVDAALSHRPEIWAAALRMFAEFPLFGLGQGAFYRLSGIEPFSGSAALAQWGGENAHNWFLQTAVQLGPVGIGLLLLIAWPVVRVGRANRSSIALFGLAGMAAGNLYGHALLVRELLVLTAIVVALYFWEAEQLRAGSLRPLSIRATRLLAATFLVLGLLAAVEAAASFRRSPFEFARLCQASRPLPADGWVSGLYQMSLPPATRRLELDLAWERPDAVRRSLTIEVRVTEADGRTVAERRIKVVQEPATSKEFIVELPPATSAYWLLSITSSHCHVPYSTGLGYDPRPLGVRVRRLAGG